MTADRSVRVAWAADAPAIARVQLRAWRQAYARLLPDEAFDEDAIAAHWRASLSRPDDARNRALVAVEDDTIVGFAATGPCTDPDADRVADGEILLFHVDPDVTGQGHGSRLLQSAIDTLRADGFSRAVTWLLSTDDAMRAFLTGAGWSADGAHRELDLNGTNVKQVRLHTSLAQH